MRNDECTLITRKAIGENIADKETRVFCEKKSVVRSEYYAAYAVGLRPRLTLSIYQPDYELSFMVNDDGTIEEPSQVIYNERKYNIYRTYEAQENDEVELTIG